ncbi:glycosyltransferase family 4 protein [Patescibacteria group bacterium]|nr:glycosyltransferase family 4 protein [Patescibacteria group bacterium]
MTANIKILLVTFEFPPQTGGVQNYYYNLLKNFKEGIEVVVLTVPHKNSSVFDQQQDFKIIRKELLFKIFWPSWFKLIFLIKRIVKEQKINLIWVGDVLPVGTAIYFLNYFFKVPYFVSTHGLDIMLPQKSARKENLMQKVLKASSFITTNSLFTKKELTNLNIAEEKITLIYPCPNIYQTAENKTQAEKIQHLKKQHRLEDKKILLTVGRLVKRKGHELVIKSLAKVLEKYPDVIYLIIGQGPELFNLQSLVNQLKLQQQVIFLTDVSDNDLPDYYAISHIFIMTTLELKEDVEGFGIVYLEAGSFGLPVIASRGVSEAVINQKTGLLVKNNEVNDLTSKIIYLLDNPEVAKEMGSFAKQRIVVEDFNWQKQSHKLKEKIKQYAK